MTTNEIVSELIRLCKILNNPHVNQDQLIDFIKRLELYKEIGEE